MPGFHSLIETFSDTNTSVDTEDIAYSKVTKEKDGTTYQI